MLFKLSNGFIIHLILFQKLGDLCSEAGCIGMSCPSDFFTTISQLEREWSKLYLQVVSYQLSAEGTMFPLTTKADTRVFQPSEIEIQIDVHHCIFFLYMYLLRVLSLYHGKPIMDLIASPCVGSIFSLIPALWSSCCLWSALSALTSSSRGCQNHQSCHLRCCMSVEAQAHDAYVCVCSTV